MKPLYFDYHTTAPPSLQTLELIEPFLKERWGIPAAPHRRGQELLPAMERAYQQIYSLLGARDADQVILTSSGAEAINHLLFSTYMRTTRMGGRNHYLAPITDEAPIILGQERLEELGCESDLVPVNAQGMITPEALADALKPRTALFSLSWANGMTGVVQPVLELSDLCRDRGVLFHLDASHVLGKVAFDLDEIAPDFVTFHGDLLHGPVGTGCLWARSGLPLVPLITGGGDQGNLRAGSVSLPLLVGLGAAAEESQHHRDHMCMEVARLRSSLEEKLMAALPGVHPLFTEVERLPHTSCLFIPGVSADALLFALNQVNVQISFGGGAYQQLTLQLKAMGFDHPMVDSVISLTLSRDTTEEEIDELVLRMTKQVRQLQKLSAHLSNPGDD